MNRLLVGDVIEKLRELPDECVQMVCTSPPYWGLRDYGVAGQIGLEPTIGEYVARLVAVFREVRRVLRDDGTLWMNLGDSYNANTGAGFNGNAKRPDAARETRIAGGTGLAPKNLIGQPWRVAFALQADGWYLRSEIVWAKPNPMPESVTDRPTKSHESIFLLTKSARYYYDAEAVREPGKDWGQRDRTNAKHNSEGFRAAGQPPHRGLTDGNASAGRNLRSVWTIPTAPYPEAHFATFPPEIPKRCILAGTSAKGACVECGAPWERKTKVVAEVKRRSGGHDKGTKADNYRNDNNRDTMAVRQTTGWRPTCDHTDAPTVPCLVLDPFLGSGTTAAIAQSLGRSWVGIELSPAYAELARKRIGAQTPGLQLA